MTATDAPADTGRYGGDDVGRKSLGTKSTGGKSLTKNSVLDKASIISMARGADVKPFKADSDELPWHAIATEDEVVADLGSSVENGLSDSEAQRRLQLFGPNKLTEVEKISFWRRLWNQLVSVYCSYKPASLSRNWRGLLHVGACAAR